MDEFIGKKFGRLTVIEVLPRERDAEGRLKKERCLCSCECGNQHNSGKGNLLSGTVKSCGCGNTDAITTHGLSCDPLYSTWANIRTRMLNPTNPRFHDYGGRGLEMESEWIDSLAAFREWVLENLGPKPSPEHSLDRADNDLGYLKGNLQWATNEQQANNCRSNKMLTFRGVTANMKQHCDRLGLNYGSVKRRLGSAGWTVEQALSTPTDGTHHFRPNQNGPIETLAGKCRDRGLDYQTVSKRISTGWTVDEALSTPTDGKRHSRPTVEPTTEPAEELIAA